MVYLGSLRTAKVQTVSHRQGQRAGTTQVAADLSHNDQAALIRIQLAEPAIPVNGDRDGLLGAFNPQDCGVAARPNHGIGLNLMVVLTVNALFVGDVGRGQKPQQRLLRSVLGQRNRIQFQN